jgi:CBS domain-containing protein
MKDEFAPRATITLPPDTVVTHPEKLPELVYDDDPATTVFTDFTKEHPVTIKPDASIDQALERMKYSGLCVLLVLDTDKRLLGEIIADDIMGEKPVRLAESMGISHREITVEMMMVPREEVRVLEIGHLHGARVGHIIATLHELERRYLLVIENGSIQGLFAAGPIGRQLGRNIMDEEVPAHSLAEIVHTLG